MTYYKHDSKDCKSLSANPVQPSPVSAPATVSIAPSELTPKQEAFAQVYVETGNAAEAYCFAYDVGDTTTAATVKNNGYKMLHHPKVAARVRALRAALCERSQMSTAELIADLEAMATADVNELMSLYTANCRHCHGEGGAWQWRDEAELGRAVDAYLRSLASPKPLPPNHPLAPAVNPPRRHSIRPVIAGALASA